ncbi:PrgI family protein [Patescibacteria group bacterium]|nr:PrgI family protein [Patescibacteria group bacterium]
MEEVHPIPQNVTSFQFKLVGDMTLKQFGYLSTGAGFAYLIFVLFSYDYPIITWPIVILSILLGVAFAFVPIGSRALDHWLVAFLKTIYSPTKRVWVKNGKTYKENPLFGNRLIMYHAGIQNAPQAKAVIAAAPQVVRPTPLPTQEELHKTVDLAREAQQLQMKIIQSERTLSQIKQQATQPTSVPVDYSQQVNKILTDLKNLMNQASEVKQQIKSIQEPEIQPEAPTAEPVLREKVKVVISTKPKQAQVALTTFPNVINGIVQDRNNNYLEGVIAVIYDKEGLPVRALKTNKLGQFTGSTPLPNETYTLELEKDNYTFDVLQIELTGQMLQPLTIIAKQ